MITYQVDMRENNEKYLTNRSNEQERMTIHLDGLSVRLEILQRLNRIPDAIASGVVHQ